jgi:hypothetical protein
MLVPILAIISSFKFGQASVLSLRSVSDDLENSATFFYQLGKMSNDGKKFVGDESAVGNATLEGADYLKWSGANDALAALVVGQIGVSLDPSAESIPTARERAQMSLNLSAAEVAK